MRDQFNPISENQRIGSDRELDDEEEEEYGTRGKGSPQPVNKSMTSTQFQVHTQHRGEIWKSVSSAHEGLGWV